MLHLFRQLNAEEQTTNEGSSNILNYLPKCKSYCYASAGRSLLYYLIHQLGLTSHDTCLLPAYVPEGVILPLIKSGLQVKFYKVDDELFIDLNKLAKTMEGDSTIRLIVLIHPFGFVQPLAPVRKLCSGRGIKIFEDCAQALFGRNADGALVGAEGDFSLFSFNKFLPVPDGAVLQSHDNATQVECDLISIDGERTDAFQAYYRHLNDNNEMLREQDPQKAYELLLRSAQAYEDYYTVICNDFSLYPPLPSSKQILSKYDFSDVIAKRIRNTRLLYENLQENVFRFVYADWNEFCVPMAVPVRVPPERRDEIVMALIEKNILLSTLVSKWNHIPSEAIDEFQSEMDFIHSHLLVPVNEFITAEQMQNIINVLNRI